MKPDAPIHVGDIVQLAPNMRTFGGCFMQVTEPKSFGAMGFIACPGETVGFAYLRPTWDEMELVGRAVWISDEGDKA